MGRISLGRQMKKKEESRSARKTGTITPKNQKRDSGAKRLSRFLNGGDETYREDDEDISAYLLGEKGNEPPSQSGQAWDDESAEDTPLGETTADDKTAAAIAKLLDGEKAAGGIAGATGRLQNDVQQKDIQRQNPYQNDDQRAEAIAGLLGLSEQEVRQVMEEQDRGGVWTDRTGSGNNTAGRRLMNEKWDDTQSTYQNDDRRTAAIAGLLGLSEQETQQAIKQLDRDGVWLGAHPEPEKSKRAQYGAQMAQDDGQPEDIGAQIAVAGVPLEESERRRQEILDTTVNIGVRMTADQQEEYRALTDKIQKLEKEVEPFRAAYEEFKPDFLGGTDQVREMQKALGVEETGFWNNETEAAYWERMERLDNQGFIRQADLAASGLPFDQNGIEANGCSTTATNNVLHAMGVDVPFEQIYAWHMENGDANFPGTIPWRVTDFIEQQVPGVTIQTTHMSGENDAQLVGDTQEGKIIDAKAQQLINENGYGVLCFTWYNEKENELGAHYVAVEHAPLGDKTDRIIVYDYTGSGENAKPTYKRYDSVEQYLEDYGLNAQLLWGAGLSYADQ